MFILVVKMPVMGLAMWCSIKLLPVLLVSVTTVWRLVLVPPLQVQLLADVPHKAAEEGPTSQVPAIHRADPDASSLGQP